ncbi:leucine-rich repeat protein [Prevotella sp. E2-28]|uniref:leucine-rich repeat protein n=1 Tax=Prevotella sp. E2-28 TaxID=2913620 RepID=UPI001EDAA882|nr:leucine-rich repeat protein [Prevotella sp. E2-28]UKK54865.1 leucine-rich repeat protein [Prevotella sp. E2-28]
MKKQLLLILMLLLPLGASADKSGTCGTNLKWNYVEETHILKIFGNGAMTDFNLYTNPWREINVERVIIEEGVTSIGTCAFVYQSSLTSVIIPNSVTKIGYAAFASCGNLSSITIPTSVTSIGGEAFYGCVRLTSITIPNSVTSIEKRAFCGCTGLTSITIPNSVTSIEKRAFCGCTGLTSITIPNSVTIIGHVAFADCSSLASITIPNSVIEIVNQAFEYCSGLKTITIPNSIESIGYRAFELCSGLTNVYCLAKNVPETDTYTFIGAYIENTILHVPAASVDAYSSIDPWRNFKDIVGIVLPEHTLTYILDGKEYKSYKIEEGEIITPEPQPTKEGYTFSGWSEIPATMPAQDVIITGSFKINKYLLTYKVDDEIVKSDSIVYNTVITPEANPTKEGYTFSGWSAIPETMPAQDVVITGSFKINKYLLTYKVDDEIVKSDSIVYNTAITPEAEPTKEGYTFSGWSEIPETMPAKDVLVTGTFSINSYKLTYMIDDKVYKDTVYEYSATIIPEPIPAGNYATFEWIDLPETMPAHDVVVHASYTTGIREMILTKPQDVQIYSPNGKKLNKLQKGLNIVRMSNGTTKKVVVK